VVARRTVSVALDTKTGATRKELRETAADVRKLSAETKAAGKSLDEMAAEAAIAGRKLDRMADEAADASRGLDKLAEKAAKAGRASEKLGAGVRISGKNFKDAKDQLGNLDRQIDQTIVHLKLLERQFAATGDASLLKQISADRSMIARLQKIRSDLTPAGPGSAGGFLSGLPPMPVLIGVAVAAGAASAPIIGAAVGGAVMGGVGAGGVVGGIVAAAHDGRVKDAFTDIGDGLGAALRGIGQPFVGPLLHEVDTLAVTAHRAIDILHDGLAQLAPVIRPLALGIDGFVEALGPGLKHAFAAAGPALRAIANELPEIGAALSDMFDSISKEGDGATMGLLAMLHAIEWLIRVTGSLIGTMSGIFEWLVRTGDGFTEWALKVLDVAGAFAFLGGPGAVGAIDAAKSHLTALNTETGHLITGLDEAKDPSRDFARNLGDTAESADDAAQKLKDFNDEIDTLFAKQMSWDQMQIRVRDGMRDLIEELVNGKRTLKENTVEGDKNRTAILAQIGLIEDLRTAYVNQTGDVAGANAMYEQHLVELQKVLIKRGYEKQAVLDIINAYRGIPAKASTEVVAPGLASTQSRLAKVEAQMNRLDGRVVRSVVATDFYSYRHDEVAASRRWGGINEHEAVAARHAADGLLREANVYSAMNPARYAFAEPATRGEAFIPRSGGYGRSMAILNHAAGWYGASVVPGGYGIRAGGSGSTRVQLEVVGVRATGNALIDAIVSGIQFKVRTAGGGDVAYLAGRR
jgi:hypothetical protein